MSDQPETALTPEQRNLLVLLHTFANNVTDREGEVAPIDSSDFLTAAHPFTAALAQQEATIADLYKHNHEWALAAEKWMNQAKSAESQLAEVVKGLRGIKLFTSGEEQLVDEAASDTELVEWVDKQLAALLATLTEKGAPDGK